MRKIDKSIFTRVNYAHRGLHDIANGIPENSLAEVFMKGYKIGDKVIRPATVKVAN